MSESKTPRVEAEYAPGHEPWLNKAERSKRIGCDPSMLLPVGKTCAECNYFTRCQSFISRKGDEEHCDWAPSRFSENWKSKYEKATAELTRLQAELLQAKKLLDKADNAMAYLTMHHNSNPDYVKGFDLAHEYMALRNQSEKR